LNAFWKNFHRKTRILFTRTFFRSLVLYHIQVIGEAANSISPEFQKQHREIPWKDIISMRHLLVHQYFGIDLEEVWNTTQKDLPHLKQEIDRILGHR